MKSLQRQGRQGTIFISKLIQLQSLLCLWLHCFPALPLAVPTPSLARFGDLSSASCAAPSPSSAAWGRAGTGGLLPDTDTDSSRSCRGRWRPAEARGQASASLSGPRQHLIVHSPIFPALGNRVPQRNFINWNAAHLNICQMRPIWLRSMLSNVVARRKGQLHSGLVIFPSSWVDAAPDLSSWRDWLASKDWKRFSCLGRQTDRAGYATHPCFACEVLSCLSPPSLWDAGSSSKAEWFSVSLHPLCLENRGLVFRNVCYKEIRECTLILSTNNLPLGKQKDVSVGWRSGVPATPWLIVWTLWFNMGLTAPSEDKWQGWLSKWVMEWSSLGTGNDSLSLPKCFLCVNVVGMLN